MDLLNKVNLFIRNIRSISHKKGESLHSSLNNCDCPVQQEQFKNALENDDFVNESLPSENHKVDDFEVQAPLLDNAEYMALAQQCCDIISELDRMQKQVKDEQIIDFISQQKARIREALLLSGATLIDEETEFNVLRHQCINGGFVKNGAPIAETIEAGIEIDGRVMVKARVVI